MPRQVVIPSETKSAEIGMSFGRTVGARRLSRKGTPLFRAKDQSWRDAVASTAIQLPSQVDDHNRYHDICSQHSDLVALKNKSMNG